MEDTYNDVWRIDINSICGLMNGTLTESKNLWELVAATGDAPEKISNHRAVVVETRIYVYGGLINNENSKNSLYWLDLTNNTWINHKTKVN